MTDRAVSSDPEQQKADNRASRRQSGLEPRPEDRAQTDSQQRREEAENTGRGDAGRTEESAASDR